MGVVERLGQWAAIGRVRPVAPPAAEAAGREGELLLREVVGASYQLEGASVLAGRRIPSRRQGRRREIDLIVATPEAIHLIEVKNWSGRVEVVDGRWRQARRGGAVVDHGDLLDDLRRKRDAVAEHLADRGLTLDDRFMEENFPLKIIFTNPNLDLDPTLESRPDVYSRRELDAYLGPRARPGAAGRLASALVAFCRDRRGGAPSSRLPADLYGRIVAALAEVGTWDRLDEYGGGVATGDLLSLTVGPRTYRRPELVELAGRLPIRVRWTRSRPLGLLRALTGLGPLGRLHLGRALLPLSPADTLTFHPAGAREPTTRRLVELERIVLG